MLWNIIFMIFGSSQAYMIHLNLQHLIKPIDKCAYHFYQCNPNIDIPCCEENNTCTLIRWNEKNYFECLKTIKLDEPCQSNLDCSELESVICSPDEKVCKCPNNYLRVNDHKCASLLGGSCVEDTDCAVPHSFCHKYKCKCKFSYLSQSNDACTSTALEKPCRSDNDCWATENTVCSENGTCACIGSYHQINNAKCASFLGGYCRHYSECWPNNSACNDNHCDCQYGFVPISYNKCQSSPLGLHCLNDIDCQKSPPGSKLTGWEYVCEEQKIFRNNFRCVSPLGNFCRHQRHCLINNSHCIYNTCTCEDGFIPESNRKCTPIHLNEPCRSEDNWNRKNHVICSNDNRWVCEQGYAKFNDYTCAPTLRQFCSKTNPCMATNSECSQDLCQCKANHWPISDTECVLFSNP